MQTFGDFLYELRKEKGMTQAELAEALGVTNKAVSKWETGEAMPETAQLLPISRIFGVTVDELLAGGRAEKTEEKNFGEGEYISVDEIKKHMFTRGKDEEEKTLADKICGAICGFIVMAGFISFLLVGVLTSMWHPYWIILPASALFCGIVGCLFDVCNPAKREKKRARGENPYTGCICGIIMLSCIIAYLIVGACTALWHPYWIIIAVGAAVCFAVGCAGDIVGHGKNKK